VLADGTVAKAGGMVVKNSTGYDLSRLYCGSLGTLAVIVLYVVTRVFGIPFFGPAAGRTEPRQPTRTAPVT